MREGPLGLRSAPRRFAGVRAAGPHGVGMPPGSSPSSPSPRAGGPHSGNHPLGCSHEDGPHPPAPSRHRHRPVPPRVVAGGPAGGAAPRQWRCASAPSSSTSASPPATMCKVTLGSQRGSCAGCFDVVVPSFVDKRELAGQRVTTVEQVHICPELANRADHRTKEVLGQHQRFTDTSLVLIPNQHPVPLQPDLHGTVSSVDRFRHAGSARCRQSGYSSVPRLSPEHGHSTHREPPRARRPRERRRGAFH